LAVSVAGRWETSIKVSLQKLSPIAGSAEAVRDLGFERLAIAHVHLVALEHLPWLHRDPFDRLLISHGFTVLTTENSFTGYQFSVLDVQA